MIILYCEQYSDEWYKAGAGVVTASRMEKVHTSEGKASKQADALMDTLVGEHWVGRREQGYHNKAMDTGTERESEARASYAFDCNEPVTQVGFVYMDEQRLVGASPDGLVGEAGLVEIKCPQLNTHVHNMRTRTPSSKYRVQHQAQLMVTGRAWLDAVSFHPGMPDVVIRVVRDERYIMGLKAAVTTFVAQMLERRKQLLDTWGPPPAGGE